MTNPKPRQNQNIDHNTIQNSSVQQTQAGRDALSFQNSDGNYAVINNVVNNIALRLFESQPQKIDWDWANRILVEQRNEVHLRLHDSLIQQQQFVIDLEEQPQRVGRSPLQAVRTLQMEGQNLETLTPGQMIVEVFGRQDVQGKLLILGVPGAGKTTQLLSLTEQLTEGALQNPKTIVPIIFELSTWKDNKQSIRDWLIAQLYDHFGGNRKAKLYERWLDQRVLLPLLDGLDELGIKRQRECAEQINEFARQYPQMVVCCRVKEFEEAGVTLSNLRGAVCLQPLTDQQIQDYLASIDQLALWQAIQESPEIRQLLEPGEYGEVGILRAPLFISLAAAVHQPQRPFRTKAELFEKYIDHQLALDTRVSDRRRKELSNRQWAYKTPEQEPKRTITCHYLSWLASKLDNRYSTELLIECISSSWLDIPGLSWLYTPGQKWLYWLLVRLVKVLIGLLVGLFSGILLGSLDGLFIGLFSGLLVLILLNDGLPRSPLDRRLSWLIGLSIGLNVKVLGALLGLYPGRLGVVIGLLGALFGLLEQRTYDDSTRLFVGLFNGLIVGLSIGLIGGLNINLIGGTPGLISGLVGSLIGGTFGLIKLPGLIGQLVNLLIGGLHNGLLGGLIGRLLELVEPIGLLGLISELIGIVLLSMMIGTGRIWLVNFHVPFVPFVLIGMIGLNSLIRLIEPISLPVVFFVLLVVLLGGVISGLIVRLQQELNVRAGLNQSIWNLLKNTALMAVFNYPLVVLLLLSVPIIKTIAEGQSIEIAIATAVEYLPASLIPTGLIALLIGFIISDGLTFVKNFCLRFVLAYSQSAPWDYVAFLNYCVERRLLQRVGGRYRFIHRELLEHFARYS